MAPIRDSAPASAGNAPFHLLAGTARVMWTPALVCSSGVTRQRLEDLPVWEKSLLAGHPPGPQHDCGDAPAWLALRQAVVELDLCTLTLGSAAMVRQVVQAMLWHLDRIIDRPVGEPRAQAIDRMVVQFREVWTQQRQGWQEVLALFRSFGDLPDLQWDELRGRLSSREWAQARRIGELLSQLTELTAFIDAIGRARVAPALPPAEHALPRSDRIRPMSVVAIVTSLIDQPSEVRGVKRSGQLARMVASEAAMLRHPLLQRLWKARFAEQQLLTYEDEAELVQWQLQPDARRTTAAAPQEARLGRGPMVVCLDTSGSMRGAPENVAKACVLQALRSAHAARRACTLLAFGGAGELLEQDLALTAEGLDNLLHLMGQGFDGGTDVQTPLERAVALVHTPAFAQADILIVSDGEFGVTPATLAMLRECKGRSGLRVHGILIGDRETIGLLEVCDQIHWVRAWRRYATDIRDAYRDGFSPVHSQSLTALYFPNAVRR